MADIKPETQQELFQEFSSTQKRPDRLPGLQRAHKPILFHTSVEQLILTAILAILFSCFIFFLGVLRGKSLSAALPPGRQAAPMIRPPMPAAASIPAQPAPVLPKKTAWKSKFPAVPSVDPAKPYTIQLITYKKKEWAEKEIALLRRSGYNGFLVPRSGDYFEVCVGQYANSAEAKKDLKFFASKYKEPFLRRRQPVV